jgi:DNA processing protein
MALPINMDAREVHRGDPRFPARLEDMPDGPESLWMSGPWVPAARAVAVVGARAAHRAALDLAFQIGAKLASLNIDVISGGALGVDAAAHQGALSADGSTVAVLGSGIDIIYPPQHAELFALIRGRGAVLTTFSPGQQPRRGSFPSRNKVIAALSEMVVVVEAAAASGSLHTARAALDLGRILCAVPGSTGTDQLLVEGAYRVASAEDVVAVLEGRPAAPPALPDDPAVVRLYAALDETPRDVGDLAFRAGLAISTCAAAVVDLEIDGLVARAAGGRYVRLR